MAIFPMELQGIKTRNLTLKGQRASSARGILAGDAHSFEVQLPRCCYSGGATIVLETLKVHP